MDKIIDFSTKRPVSVLMYFSLVIVLGAASVFCINTSLLPKAKYRWILVYANYDGVRAEEIRKLVAIPLEQALASLKDVKNIETVSRDGSCAAKIELKWSADIDTALLECDAILDAATETLPDDCPRPRAKKLGVFSGSIEICLVPKDKDIFAATEYAQNELKSRLLSFEECSSVEIFGGKNKEIIVTVDLNKAAFYGLSLDETARRLNLSNYDYPAGTIQDGQDDILFKTEGTYKSFQDILDTPLKTNKGVLKLGDIARVEKDFQKTEEFFFCDGEQCVEMKVFCKNNQNPLALSGKVKKLLCEINSRDQNFTAFITKDSSQEIFLSLKCLLFSALAGAAISFALVFLFFRSATIAALIASVILLSVLFTFFVLFCLGKSANIISLAGVTLCLGMIIDNSIVAMESVLEEADEKENFPKTLSRAIKKISLSNTASTSTTIIVFAPIFFIGGIIGELFADLGIAVLSGMAFSLLFSFSALPAACALFFKKAVLKARKMDLSYWEARYKKAAALAKNKRFLCPAITAGSLVLSLLILLPIKKEFQPQKRQSDFTANVMFNAESGVDSLERKAKSICQSVMALKSAHGVLARGGFSKSRPELLADIEARAEKISFTVKASKIKKAKAECEALFNALGLDFNFEEESDLISERLRIKNKSLFLGKSPEELFSRCQKLFGNNFFPRQKKTFKTFKANKSLMQNAGITPLALSTALKSSFDGTEAFPYYENGKEKVLRVQFERNVFSSKKNLSALPVPARAGMIPVSALGRWENESGESILYRHNGKDAKIILNGALEKKGFSNEETLSLKKREMSELFKSGAFLLFIVLVLLYCVLGAQTESFRAPLIYFLAIPPAFLGAALFLAVFRSSLNINSIIAFVTLFGTSVNNSIILHEGGTKKFSSVLITTATSVASLVPFALDPFNLNPQSSLALAICGGLALSAAASLIMIPAVSDKKTLEEQNDKK